MTRDPGANHSERAQVRTARTWAIADLNGARQKFDRASQSALDQRDAAVRVVYAYMQDGRRAPPFGPATVGMWHKIAEEACNPILGMRDQDGQPFDEWIDPVHPQVWRAGRKEER